jgi:DNA (cytosine-5)-methyltransferase 1
MNRSEGIGTDWSNPRKKRALDLFCGAGGASKGLSDYGYFDEIIGVDINDQPNYPYKQVQSDVFKLPYHFFQDFDFIWASPPCQHYTRMLNHGLTDRNKHPDLVHKTRILLEDSGKMFVIENVVGAPLKNPIMLCGEMFGLKVTRHRLFECLWSPNQPPHKKHKGHHIRKQNDGGYYYRVYGHETGKASWGKAMGIDWMRSPELAQAIPPAYSKFIIDDLEERLRSPSNF